MCDLAHWRLEQKWKNSIGRFLQNLVAFSEYPNFTYSNLKVRHAILTQSTFLQGLEKHCISVSQNKNISYRKVWSANLTPLKKNYIEWPKSWNIVIFALTMWSTMRLGVAQCLHVAYVLKWVILKKLRQKWYFFTLVMRLPYSVHPYNDASI